MAFQSLFLPTGRPNEVEINWDAIGLGEEKPKLRSDLTPEQKTEAERIGRIEFKSAGATRKR